MNIPPRSERFASEQVEHTCDIGGHKVNANVWCLKHKLPWDPISEESNGQVCNDWDCDFACKDHLNPGAILTMEEEENKND